MPTPDPHALPDAQRPADALKAAAIEELPISGARFQQADLSGAGAALSQRARLRVW